MRRSRRPYLPPPPPPDALPPEGSRWERVSIYLEVFGFGVLFFAGLIAAVWGAIDHFIRVI